MNADTKIVVFCAYGNVRSNGVGGILKDVLGMRDVIVAGRVTTTDQTKSVLCRWADIIIIAGDNELSQILHDKGVAGKAILLDIGVDRWGFGRHPDLVRTICNKMRETGFANITPEMEARYLKSIYGNLRNMAKELE